LEKEEIKNLVLKKAAPILGRLFLLRKLNKFGENIKV